MNYTEVLNIVKGIAIEAGKIILEVYNSPDFEVELKSDRSPVTKADKLANEYIVENLKANFPEFGVLAEESKKDPSRLEKKYVWIVDPLDGTKEFIKRNGEFTVNIGLVEDGIPKVGVVGVPAKKETYFAACDLGAFYEDAQGIVTKIGCSTIDKIEEMTLVKSRSHASEQLTNMLNDYHFKATKDSGSSIKICLIARGAAEVYFRFGPTNEWDVCAAHCVLNEAGGKMTKCSGDEITYNHEETLNTNGFIASNNVLHQKFVEMALKYK